MREKVAVIAGVRTPFCRAGGVFKEIAPEDLGAYAAAEALARSGLKADEVDELVFGNVTTPTYAANIARLISVKAGLPVQVPAFTVNRNCASGMEAIVSGALRLLESDARISLVGGTESMSRFPVEYPAAMRDFLVRLSKAKGFGNRLRALTAFRFGMLKPQLPQLTDPLCGCTMGQTAENIVKEFCISRLDQDMFALNSQLRAYSALESGRLAEEIIPIPLPKTFDKVQEHDDGPRAGQTLEQLERLKPVFDRVNGTVTAGSSSQITDGAVALLLARESVVKEKGLTPLGYITAFQSAGLAPSRMGLGPAFAISKLLAATNTQLDDYGLFEINEAFAGQVLASVAALASDEFCKKELHRDRAVGRIDLDDLNVNGGAIALGHPLGASGARLVLTLLKEMRRRGVKKGIAALCVGGGQGEAVTLEAVL